MKIRILTVLLAMLALLNAPALAEDSVHLPRVEAQLSETRLTAPGPVEVTVTVTNNSGTAMPGSCALYDPDGRRIAGFGTPTLMAGESVVWTGVWHVTQTQLDAGQIVFAFACTHPGDDGSLRTKIQPYSIAIIHDDPAAHMVISRIITPPVARSGQQVYITYVIRNMAAESATDVTITESAAAAPALLGTLTPGEIARHTFAFAMPPEDVVSSAAVTWSSAGSEHAASVADETILYGDVPLYATLTAERSSAREGDTITLCLTLQNRGSQDVAGITVTDPLLGEVFTDLYIPAGSLVTLEKELLLEESCELLFTVSGVQADGNGLITATEMLPLIVLPSAGE